MKNKKLKKFIYNKWQFQLLCAQNIENIYTSQLYLTELLSSLKTFYKNNCHIIAGFLQSSQNDKQCSSTIRIKFFFNIQASDLTDNVWIDFFYLLTAIIFMYINLFTKYTKQQSKLQSFFKNQFCYTLPFK